MRAASSVLFALCLIVFFERRAKRRLASRAEARVALFTSENTGVGACFERWHAKWERRETLSFLHENLLLH
jgi:hypothetical protein